VSVCVTGWFKEDGNESRNYTFFNKANSGTGKQMRVCITQTIPNTELKTGWN